MDIIPAIVEIHQKELGRKLHLVAPFVSTIQVAVADNTLAPAETVHDPSIFTPIIAQYGETHAFEAHLLVQHPLDYLEKIVAAGFTSVIIPVECEDPREFLAEAQTHDIRIGLSIDADTDFEAVEPFLEDIDFVQVATSELGNKTALYQPEALEKVKILHRNLPDMMIEVNGRMTPETAKTAKDAGATHIVSTSYIFQNEQEIDTAIEALKNA